MPTIVPGRDAQPGFLILQRPSLDFSSLCIAIHSLLLLQKPRFVHCGIYLGDGKMVTAALEGGVGLQDAGAADNIAVPFAWRNWDAAKARLLDQAGKPYDLLAWALCATEPLGNLFGVEHYPCTGRSFICSSLVGSALHIDDPSRPAWLACRCCTPNDVARFLGI